MNKKMNDAKMKEGYNKSKIPIGMASMNWRWR